MRTDDQRPGVVCHKRFATAGTSLGIGQSDLWLTLTTSSRLNRQFDSPVPAYMASPSPNALFGVGKFGASPQARSAEA